MSLNCTVLEGGGRPSITLRALSAYGIDLRKSLASDKASPHVWSAGPLATFAFKLLIMRDNLSKSRQNFVSDPSKANDLQHLHDELVN